MRHVFLLIAAINAQAGGFLSGFFRPTVNPELIFKTPKDTVVSEEEILEEKRDFGFGWSQSDAERLEALKRDSRIRSYNAFQRAMAKAGIIDSAEVIDGGLASGSGNLLAISTPVQAGIESSKTIVGNELRVWQSPGIDGQTGASQTGSAVAAAALAMVDTVAALELSRKKSPKELIREIDRQLGTHNRSALLKLFSALVIKSQTSSEDSVLKYCDSHSSLLLEFANADLLRRAAGLGLLNLVKKFVAMGANINLASGPRGLLPIQSALVENRFNVVHYLTGLVEFNPNALSASGESVFTSALNSDDSGVICDILVHPDFSPPEQMPERYPQQVKNHIRAVIEFSRWTNQLSSGTLVAQLVQDTMFFSLLELGHAQGVLRLLEVDSSILVRYPNRQIIGTLFSNFGIADEEEYELPLIKRQLLRTLEIILARAPSAAAEVFAEACKKNLFDFVKILVLYGQIEPGLLKEVYRQQSASMKKILDSAIQTRLMMDGCDPESQARLSLEELQESTWNELIEWFGETQEQLRQNLRLDQSNSLLAQESSERSRLFEEETRVSNQIFSYADAEQADLRRDANVRENSKRVSQERAERALAKVSLLEREIGQQSEVYEALCGQETYEFERISREQARELAQIQSALNTRAERERLNRETVLNQQRFRALQEIETTETTLWAEFLAPFNSILGSIRNLLNPADPTQHPVAAAMAKGTSVIEVLLLNEGGEPREWTRKMLAERGGVAAVENAIQNKKVSAVKAILGVMNQLELDPRELFQLTRNRFGAPKKGSDEFRILKELRESSLTYLERLESQVRAQMIRQEQRQLIDQQAQELARMTFQDYLDELQPMIEMSRFLRNPESDEGAECVRQGADLLFLAALADNDRLIDQLHEQGLVDPLRRFHGYTPLSIAIFRNSPMTVDALLTDPEGNPRPQARELLTGNCEIEGILPVLYAIKSESPDALRKLRKIMKKLQIAPQRTLLDYAIAMYGSNPTEIQQEILKLMTEWLDSSS